MTKSVNQEPLGKFLSSGKWDNLLVSFGGVVILLIILRAIF